MANVTITIPDALVPRLVATRAMFPQYAGLSDIAAFKAITADYWRGVLVSSESQKAADAAEVTRLAAVDTAIADSAGIV
jgi:hypothetical protein